jgi:hypothetical protein
VEARVAQAVQQAIPRSNQEIVERLINICDMRKCSNLSGSNQEIVERSSWRKWATPRGWSTSKQSRDSRKLHQPQQVGGGEQHAEAIKR